MTAFKGNEAKADRVWGGRGSTENARIRDWARLKETLRGKERGNRFKGKGVQELWKRKIWKVIT